MGSLFYFGVCEPRDPDVSTRNVNSYGGLQSAVTAIGAGNANILITDIQNIITGNSATIGPNTRLHITPGSGISVHSGASLFIYGPIVAGPYRIIYGSGDSVFGVNAHAGIFYDIWDGSTTGGTTSMGIGKPPGAYNLDADSFHADMLHLPSGANPAPTSQGQIAYNTALDALIVGDGTNSRTYTAHELLNVIITSPDLLGNPDNQVLTINTSGTSMVVTGASVFSSDSGVSLDLITGGSVFGFSGAAPEASKILDDATTGEIGGVSVYGETFSTGTTTVPPDRPIIMDLGDASTADWLQVVLTGYFEGNKP